MTQAKTTTVKTLKHSLLALSLLSSFNLLAQTHVIHAGTLLKVAGEKTLSKQTLVITDGTSTRIENGFIKPSDIEKDAQLIDLSSSFVMAGLDGINAALRAGVDSIEHGSYANKESIKLFKKTGAYLVPTLMAGDTVVGLAKNTNFMSDAIKAKAKAIRVGADMTANFKNSIKSGVKIAYGTDSGVSPHGNNGKEGVLMAQAGMKNSDILVAATINAADLIGMSDSLGTLAQGKIADIIAFDGNPLQNIEELLDVDFVMKGGKVIKN